MEYEKEYQEFYTKFPDAFEANLVIPAVSDNSYKTVEQYQLDRLALNFPEIYTRVIQLQAQIKNNKKTETLLKEERQNTLVKNLPIIDNKINKCENTTRNLLYIYHHYIPKEG